MGLWISALYRLRHLRPELTYHGLRVPVTGSHVTRPVWKHLWRKSFEVPEITAVLALMRDTDTVLELGSGMGVVSGIAALAHPLAKFAAYEANPALIPVIAELHAINGITNVDVNNAILLPNPTKKMQTFNLHEHYSQSSIIDQIESSHSVEVPVADAVAVMAELQPDVFICDIEGAETVVFDGLSLVGSHAGLSKVFQACADARLYPRVDLSSEQVVAFERVEP